MKIFESGNYYDILSLFLVNKKGDNKFNITEINPIIKTRENCLIIDLESEKETKDLIEKIYNKKNKILRIILENKEKYGKNLSESIQIEIKNRILKEEPRVTDSDIKSLIGIYSIPYIEIEQLELLPIELDGNIEIYGKKQNINDNWCIILTDLDKITNENIDIEEEVDYYLNGIAIPKSEIEKSLYLKKIKNIKKEELKLEKSFFYLDLSIKGKFKYGIQEWPNAKKKNIENYVGKITFNSQLPIYNQLTKIKSIENIDESIELIEKTKLQLKDIASSRIINTIEDL
ncbi:hypothetical protein V6O07_23610 [Arthrospira platensis SPKY2]